MWILIQAPSYKGCMIALPQIMSRAQLDMYGQISNPLPPISLSMVLTIICDFSEKTSMKVSRMLKWKVGVIAFLCLCHLEPYEHINPYINSEVRTNCTCIQITVTLI